MRAVDAATRSPDSLISDGKFSGFQTNEVHNPKEFWRTCPGVSTSDDFRERVVAEAGITLSGTVFPEVSRLRAADTVTNEALFKSASRALWLPTGFSTWLAHKLMAQRRGDGELHLPQPGKIQGNLFPIQTSHCKIIVRAIFLNNEWKIRTWIEGTTQWSEGNRFAPYR